MLIGNLNPTVPRIPLRDFFKNPLKTAFQISPDGNYLSFMGPYQNRLNVYVQKRGTNEVIRVTGETARDITDYFWKGNNRIIYRKDFKGDENYHLVSVERDGRNLKDLTPFEGVRAEIIDIHNDHDGEIIIGLNKRNPQVFDAYRLNVVTGEMKLIAKNPGNIVAWKTDHRGKIRIAVASEGVNNTLLYRETEEVPFKPVITTNFRVTINPLFFTFDNQNVYAASNIGRDKLAIVIFDIKKGKEVEVIFKHPEVDVKSLHYSPKRKVLTYVVYTTWKDEYQFLDSQTESEYIKLRRKMPLGELVFAAMNRNEDIHIIRRYNDRTRGAYYLYETAIDKLVKLSDISPWLKEEDMCELKPITYKSRDGLLIHGYLTLPRGMEPRNLPVVVNPHGGPWTRNDWGFNPEVQFLANRGFVVLQMNFRGSTGYGRRFWELSFKQWGRKMQDDITDGVYWLAKQGVANPKKIVLYGASYGGYATLAGVTFNPDLYACGVNYVGISDIFSFLKTIPPYWEPIRDQLYAKVGDPKKDAKLLLAASPIFHVAQIKVPLLVAHGVHDPRVNISQSNQIVAALRKRGLNVEYMVKENEGHGFHNEENRFDFYEAMEKFLAKNLLNITLTSSAFSYGCPIPPKYARFDAHPAGFNYSPPLFWANVPVGIKSFVLICIDPDGGNWIHWVLFNIPSTTNHFNENVPKNPILPDNSKQGNNSWNLIGYDGPSPPKGTGIHHYYFTIYALDTTLDLPFGSTKNQVVSAMKGHILRQGQLMGTYQYQ